MEHLLPNIITMKNRQMLTKCIYNNFQNHVPICEAGGTVWRCISATSHAAAASRPGSVSTEPTGKERTAEKGRAIAAEKFMPLPALSIRRSAGARL